MPLKENSNRNSRNKVFISYSNIYSCKIPSKKSSILILNLNVTIKYNFLKYIYNNQFYKYKININQIYQFSPHLLI